MANLTKDKNIYESISDSNNQTTNNAISSDNNTLNIEIQSDYYLITISNGTMSIKSNDIELSTQKENLELHTRLHCFKIAKQNSGFKIITDNTELEISSNSQPLKISKTESSFEVTVSITSFMLQYENNSLKFLDLPQAEFSIDSNCDNNCLIISEQKQKIFLPYTISEVEEKYQSNKSKYDSLTELIEKEYIVSLDNYRHPMLARFREAYKLIKVKEKGSIKEAIDLGLELMFRSNLNPAIITACKNLKELDIYLDCLEENDLENFFCFKIIYQMAPSAV